MISKDYSLSLVIGPWRKGIGAIISIVGLTTAVLYFYVYSYLNRATRPLSGRRQHVHGLQSDGWGGKTFRQIWSLWKHRALKPGELSPLFISSNITVYWLHPVHQMVFDLIFFRVTGKMIYMYILTSIKRPQSIQQPLSTVPIYSSVICCTWHLYSTATSIKRPRPPFCCRKCIIYMVFYLH